VHSTSCFVATIDLKLADKLRNDLDAQGFVFAQPAHTLFSAQKKGVSCTLYSSGKLTVQGKEMREFIEFYLEPEILGNVSFTNRTEELMAKIDLHSRIGVDEAGKGDFFGPLCIAGLKAGDEEIRKLLDLGVKDSKQMSDTTILKIAVKIKQDFAHAIVVISPKRYNELYETFHNLNRLLAWGHATAIDELHKKTGCDRALIDQFGGTYLVENALRQKNLSIQLTQRTHAEADPVVAGASILARASFVEQMQFLSKGIGIELPKGASQKVLAVGRQIVEQKGREILDRVCKKHFKTYNEVLTQ
jgi:ribonuclease HIII